MQSCLDCKHFQGYTQFHCQPYFVICPQDLRNFPCPYKLGMANPFCNPGTSIRLPGVSHLVRSGVPSLAVQQGQVRYPFRDEVYLRLISRTEKRKHFGHLRTTMPMETCKPSNLDSTRYIEQILIVIRCDHPIALADDEVCLSTELSLDLEINCLDHPINVDFIMGESLRIQSKNINISHRQCR